MPGFTEAVLCWLPAKTAIEAAGKVEEGSNPRVYRGLGVAPPRWPPWPAASTAAGKVDEEHTPLLQPLTLTLTLNPKQVEDGYCLFELELALQHGQSAPLGSATARILCLLRARLVALSSSALPGRGRLTRCSHRLGCSS